MGAVVQAVLRLVHADADHRLRVALVVDADVTIGVEHQTHLVASEMAVRFAHDDVLAVGLEVTAAAAVGRLHCRGQRRRPDELAADDRHHILVGLDHLDFVARLSLDHFVAQYSTPQHCWLPFIIIIWKVAIVVIINASYDPSLSTTDHT